MGARDPAGNEMREGKELRSASNTRRAKFNKLLAEQVGSFEFCDRNTGACSFCMQSGT